MLKSTCQKAFNTKTKFGKRVSRSLIFLNRIFIGLLVAEIVWKHQAWIMSLEIFLGTIFALELAARFWIDKSKSKFFFNLYNTVDLIVIVAVFAKFFIFSALLLQMISSLRILRSYRALAEISRQNKRVFYYYETLKIVLTLLVFILIMSSLVFNILGPKNEAINNFTDALYFTITTLTTTGYGDITVQDQGDKLLVIFIMIFGAAIFLKLATNLFRPRKVFYRCSHCGLTHHEPDASHCKHCCHTVKIQTEGQE